MLQGIVQHVAVVLVVEAGESLKRIVHQIPFLPRRMTRQRPGDAAITM
jgi:hypothetical protein